MKREDFVMNMDCHTLSSFEAIKAVTITLTDLSFQPTLFVSKQKYLIMTFGLGLVS